MVVDEMDYNFRNDSYSFSFPDSIQSFSYDDSASSRPDHYLSSSSELYPSFGSDSFSSFNGSSQSSFTESSTPFPAPDHNSSFASFSEYGYAADYDQAAIAFSSTSPESLARHGYGESSMSGLPSSPTFYGPSNGAPDLLSLVTDSNLRILNAIAQNIRKALDDGLTKRRLLRNKVEEMKQGLDGTKNDVFAAGPGVDLREKGAGSKPARRAARRRTPGIKPPRLNPHKTDKEHEIAVSEYQAEFKKRHQLNGYEMLVAFTEGNIDHLTDRLGQCNVLEAAANDFLEGRADPDELTQLEILEWLMNDMQKDLEQVRQCFAQLEDIGL